MVREAPDLPPRLFYKVHEYLTSSGMRKDYDLCKDDDGRVECLLQSEFIKSNILQYIEKLSTEISFNKCEDKALKHNTDGLQCFPHNLDRALLHYTSCIAYSTQSRTRSVAYANRSLVLFRKKLYGDCLQNISFALSNGYSGELYKLYNREGLCHLFTGHKDAANSSFTKTLQLLTESNLSDEEMIRWRGKVEKQRKGINFGKVDKQRSDAMPKLADRNETYTSLSAACTVGYTPSKGRYVSATHDIMPGEIVAVEEPYGFYLLDQHKFEHCHHCLSFTYSSIPCECCAWVLYCSEECKHSAQVYHFYERAVMPLLCGVIEDTSSAAFLALRILCKTPKEMLHAALSGEYKDDHMLVRDNMKYEHDSYWAIHRLQTNAAHRSKGDVLGRALSSIYLSMLLNTYSTFHADRNISIGQSSVLMLHYQQLSACNALQISLFCLNRKYVAMSYDRELGGGVYSTLSLFNHSCDSNTTRDFVGKKCVFRTIDVIHKGEELCLSYGPNFRIQSLAGRQRKLRECFFFTCSCRACVKDWSMFDQISINPVPKCESCFAFHRTMDWKMRSYTCTNCRQENNFLVSILKVSQYERDYQTAFDDINHCTINQPLKQLVQCLIGLDKYVKLPNQLHLVCKDALQQCYSIQGFHHNTIS